MVRAQPSDQPFVRHRASGFGRFRIIAHRGASASHPENTLAAFDQALSEQCDGLELDLQLSRDGVPIVYHDSTLRKIGGGRRAVRDTDWADIASLDAGGWFDPRYAGERVPSLDQVLERYGRRTHLLLELKARLRDIHTGVHRELAMALVAQLRRRRLTRRVMVLSFDLETLEVVSGQDVGIATALNLKAPGQMTKPLAQALDRVSAMSLDVRSISPRLVAAVHDAGKPVLSFTCNTRRTVGRALSAGADGIISDRPGWLRQVIETISVSPEGTRQ